MPIKRNVTVAPRITHLDPPRITGSTLVELHSTTYLSCSGGNYSVVVNRNWLFNGRSALPPHAVSTSGDLEIRDMTRSEVGTYTCIIEKDEVTANTSVLVSVIEANSPIGVLTLSANQPIANGKLVLVFHDSVLIDCHSQRNDITNYTWQFNGSSTLPRSVTAMGVTLYINLMEGATEGNYTCIASKNGLATSASVWVSVKEEKARVIDVTASPTHPRANDRLDIVCYARGFPQPTIIWSFTDPMGQNYIPPGLSNQTPYKIHIDKFQPSLHSGTWTCMARNSVGVGQTSIQI
ncbi:hypothetical protein ACJMK2_025316 [Sinanodonta woodiana]|uniref:Ig-like domain-containing protein n=1 Tax=Sinanodonta woodiana TaxID=1069815 RepID=A0ABD3XII4_SINWO